MVNDAGWSAHLGRSKERSSPLSGEIVNEAGWSAHPGLVVKWLMKLVDLPTLTFTNA